MENFVQVKNIKIGEGIPKICIPLVAKTKEEFIETAKGLTSLKFDLVELRIDHFQEVENLEAVKELTKEIRNILKDTPILFTFRSFKEGGEKEISNEYYKTLNIEISKTGLVDLIDIELFTGDEIVNEMVEKIHENNIKIVMSNHDFHRTPEKDEIVKRLCRMQDLKSDIPKIAVMPNTTADVLTLLSATEEMKKNHHSTPVITMSMGGLGVISRISGETFGSALTFGAVKKASAPGQVPVEELYTILNILHTSK